MDSRCERGSDYVNMKLLVDMNLPPVFADILVTDGIDSYFVGALCNTREPSPSAFRTQGDGSLVRFLSLLKRL